MTMIPKQLSQTADLNLEFYKKQAKALLKRARSGDAEANATLRKYADGDTALHVAQLAIAREQGFASWPRFQAFIIESSLDYKALTERFIDAAMSDETRAAAMLADHPELAEAGLYAALVLGDWGRVAAALELNPELVLVPSGPKACDLLLYVCFSRFGRKGAEREQTIALTARLLLTRNANPDAALAADHGPLSCLYGASGVLNNAELTRILLEAGADPNDGESLYHATEHRDLECLRVLLEYGARVDGSNAIKHMLDREDPEGLGLLLEAGGNPNETNPEGDTALHWAVRRNRSPKVISMLIDYGADLDAAREDGRTAYAMAIVSGQTAVAELLKARGADTRLSAIDSVIAGGTEDVPLESANSPANARLFTQLAEAGNLKAVKAMLDAGVPVESTGDGGITALHYACWRGDADMIKLLISEGAPLELPDTMYGATPAGFLHHGSTNYGRGDYARGAKLLINAGCSMAGCNTLSGNAALDAVLKGGGFI
jgi:ankyrin repeat protein